MTNVDTGRYSVRPVVPARDARLLHTWVTTDRATFWGMAECTVADVAEIYTWIAEQDHLEAMLILIDDLPVGLLQTYDPYVDEIGGFYDRQPGDLGIHLLLDDDPARHRHTPALLAELIRLMFARAGVRRLVFEPDTRNPRPVALLRRLGATPGPRVHIRTSVFDKPAQFFFLTAPRSDEV